MMNKRPVFYSNKPQRKNIPELSPRLAVKKQETFHHGVGIHAQASAQMKRRKLDTKSIRL